MKILRPKYTNFVSAIDQFSAEFDRTHPLSDSQMAEIAKYQRISLLRDDAIVEVVAVETIDSE